MFSDEDVQQITKIVRSEITKALATPPAPPQRKRKYGLNGGGNRQDQVHFASPEREAKIVAAILAFDEKRLAYESDPEERVPGIWYFNDLENLLKLAVEGPIPEHFGRVYRCLYEIARLLLVQHQQVEPIDRQYPCNQLVTSCGTLAESLRGVERGTDIGERFDSLRQLRDAVNALEQIRQSGGDTISADLFFTANPKV